mgnify:CR=1 FL=1
MAILRRSGLNQVVLTPCAEMVSRAGALSRPHSAPAWIHRCAVANGVHPAYLVLHSQREQGMVADEGVYDPAYKVSVVFGSRPTMAAQPESRRGVVRTVVLPTTIDEGRERWVIATGVWQLMAICGVGIMDPGSAAWVPTERYLGLDRQWYYCAKAGASILRRWRAGERLLRDRQAHKGDALGGIMFDRDELVTIECTDLMGFAALVHTPHIHSHTSLLPIARTCGLA